MFRTLCLSGFSGLSKKLIKLALKAFSLNTSEVRTYIQTKAVN